MKNSNFPAIVFLLLAWALIAILTATIITSVKLAVKLWAYLNPPKLVPSAAAVYAPIFETMPTHETSPSEFQAVKNVSDAIDRLDDDEKELISIAYTDLAGIERTTQALALIALGSLPTEFVTVPISNRRCPKAITNSPLAEVGKRSARKPKATISALIREEFEAV